jgi:hypothetical protein
VQRQKQNTIYKGFDSSRLPPWFAHTWGKVAAGGSGSQ